MKKLILKQIEFDNWANNELLQILKTANPMNERALLLFSHINSVNIIWLNRLRDEEIKTQLFEERNLEDNEKLLAENYQNWKSYLEPLSVMDLDKVVQFNFPIDGTKREINIKDAIIHITNHSSYHRGQIITLIKESVETLPHLGYVFYASKIL